MGILAVDSEVGKEAFPHVIPFPAPSRSSLPWRPRTTTTCNEQLPLSLFCFASFDSQPIVVSPVSLLQVARHVVEMQGEMNEVTLHLETASSDVVGGKKTKKVDACYRTYRYRGVSK